MKPSRLSLAAFVLFAFALSGFAATNDPPVLRSEDPTARQVVIDIALIALPDTNIAAIARRNRKAAAGNDEILALWQDGQGRLIETRRLVTIEDSEVNSAAGEEIIYPTEFESTLAQYSANDSSMLVNPVTPGSLETQQVGLHVQASVSSQSDSPHPKITLKAEYRTFQKWEEIVSRAESKMNPKSSLSLMQPRFYCQSIETFFVAQDGATTVLGGFTGSDAAERIFLLVTIDRQQPEAAPERERGKRERRGDRP